MRLHQPINSPIPIHKHHITRRYQLLLLNLSIRLRPVYRGIRNSRMEHQQLRRVEQVVAFCDAAVEDLAIDVAALEELKVLKGR